MQRHPLFGIFALDVATHILGKQPRCISLGHESVSLISKRDFDPDEISELLKITYKHGITSSQLVNAFKLFLDLRLGKGAKVLQPLSLVCHDTDSQSFAQNDDHFPKLCLVTANFDDKLTHSTNLIIPFSADCTLSMKTIDIIVAISKKLYKDEMNYVLAFIADDSTVVYYRCQVQDM